MSTEPPSVRSVSLSTSAPFVTVVERHEDRSDHLTMAGAMLVATALTVAIGTPLAGLLTAFVAGYAVCNYVSYSTMYEEVSA